MQDGRQQVTNLEELKIWDGRTKTPSNRAETARNAKNIPCIRQGGKVRILVYFYFYFNALNNFR